ncbi:MAG TPA: PD-(D/E)XK nuclease family protein [Pirellulales bacterium]|nr:PD-(D/E)XK nuclease family protein [Pirellulales bacterium]
MKRIFLGWQKPALMAAADFLFEHYAARHEACLSDVVVALPSARATRRMLEVLVEQAEARQVSLAPPQIVTIGHLPEELYDGPARVAGRLARQLAWSAALDDIEPALLRRLTGEADAQRLALAEVIERLHDDLAGHGLRFADAVGCVERFDETEAERWRALAAAQSAYEARLEKLGLSDVQLARLEAIRAGNCRTEHDIVLVGVADLPIAVARLLSHGPIAERVTSLIYAPPELADRFDPLGSLVTEAWCRAMLALADEQLVVADRPADQATAVVRAIADFAGRYAADQITVGVPDVDVVPYLERRFEQFDLPSRYGEAVRLSETAPYRLLAAVADYLEGQRFADLAALVRHPDVQIALQSEEPSKTRPDSAPATGSSADLDLLTALDTYYCEHLQARLSGRPLGRSAAARAVAEIQTRLDRWLEKFSGKQSLPDWAQRIVDLLIAIYEPQQLDRGHARGRLTIEACDTIHGILVEASQLDAGWAGRWSATEAIRLLLRQIESEPIPPVPDQAAIEVLGWLELPLDDAPALVVTGFNDGFVPSSVNADPFLPNALRRQLGLLDNDRRYARDAYGLAVLLGSRERLTLIAGRRSAQGDPLTPSRLAFACPRERVARRVLRYFGREVAPASPTLVPHGLPAGARKSGFAPPKPKPSEQPIREMRVTQFRDYLACPYRYYLRHVLSLHSLDDLAEELEASAFGSLAHDVLREFGADPDNSLLTDAEAICQRLGADLDRLVRERFGRHRLPAVELQVEHLRLRLEAFAWWQAGWAAEGWRIVNTEVEVKGEQAPLLVDGKPMFLKARLDRVDRNDLDGRYVIFDYKTSDSGDPPEKTHRVKGEWVDLQLPLYRHLASAIGIGDSPALGYIVLPKDLKKITGHLAAWDQAELDSADTIAKEVVRGIWSQKFLPMKQPPPRFSEEFAAICLDEQFGVSTEDEEEI